MKKMNSILTLSALLLLATPHISHANILSSLFNAIFSTPQKPTTHAHTFNENEARDYINQTIASLERALRSHMQSAELSNLKRLVQDNVRNAQYAYQHHYSFTSAGKRYKKDIIDQFLSSAVLEYIEKTSYDYTYNCTYDHTIATRISTSMRNNALALIAQNSVLNFERLTPFVGHALERAITDMLAKNNHSHNTSHHHAPTKPTAPTYHAPHPSAPPAEHVYTSDECVVCLENFGGETKRIYLKPCGHDMCKKCAFDWFFGATQKTECPQCRSSVNLHQLQNDIV